jgi:putative transposase
MARTRYTAEEIIGHLRTVESEAGAGIGIADACRKLGLTEQTYDRWKNEDGGLRVEHAKRLKGLEQEHARLKRLVADLSLDKSIVTEVAAGNFSARPDAEKRCALRRPRSRFPNAGRREWSGHAGPPSSMCPLKRLTRTDCGHGSSCWPTSMAATGIGGSPPCSAGRMARESQAGGAALAVGGADGAAETTHTGPALVSRWLLYPPAG